MNRLEIESLVRKNIDFEMELTDTFNGVGVDSLDLISLVMDLEKELDLVLPDSLAEGKDKTLEEFISELEKAVNE